MLARRRAHGGRRRTSMTWRRTRCNIGKTWGAEDTARFDECERRTTPNPLLGEHTKRRKIAHDIPSRCRLSVHEGEHVPPITYLGSQASDVPSERHINVVPFACSPFVAVRVLTSSVQDGIRADTTPRSRLVPAGSLALTPAS